MSALGASACGPDDLSLGCPGFHSEGLEPPSRPAAKATGRVTGPSGRRGTWGRVVSEDAWGAGTAFTLDEWAAARLPLLCWGQCLQGTPTVQGLPGAGPSVNRGTLSAQGSDHTVSRRGGPRETLFAPRGSAWGPRPACQAPSKAGFELCGGAPGGGAGSSPPEHRQPPRPPPAALHGFQDGGCGGGLEALPCRVAGAQGGTATVPILS